MDEYVRLRRETTMLEARAAGLLVDIDRDGLFEDAGFLTAAAFLRNRMGDSAGEASRRVAEARGLVRHPVLGEAYGAAGLDRPRVALLLAAARVAPEVFTRDEQVLVDSVAGLSFSDARRVVEYWKQAADHDAAVEDAEHLHGRRRLHVSETLGGMVRLDGKLDPEAAKPC